MKQLLYCAFFLGGIAMFTGVQGCCTPNATLGSQPVGLRPQETSMWCWAASGEMCMDFLGRDVTQCDQANKRFGRTDCCNSSVPSDCVNGGWPEFDKYDFTFNTTSDTPLSWDALKTQIYCFKKPFAFSWHWNGGGGHMMVVTGYAQIGSTRYVAINDPWAPNRGDQRFITYEEFVSGSDHTHWDDYYNITKK
ncbi:MAG: C39 family peptidase [Bacteroidetes bacterium]|nr:C39 family peptidase [Bacteroidota bacterium]